MKSKCIKIILLLVIPILISANTSSNYTIEAYNGYETPLLKKIEKTTQELFNSIKENKPSVMNDLFTEEAKTTDNRMKHFYRQIKDLIPVEKTSLLKIIKVDVISQRGDGIVLVPKKYTGKFLIRLPSSYEKSILSLYFFQNDSNTYLLSILYIFKENNWQLYSFRIGSYKLFNESAVDIFVKAKKLHKMNHSIMSVLWLLKVEKYLSPSPFCFYEEEDEIIQFKNELVSSLNKKYHFPIVMKNIKSKPLIYSIDSVFVKDKLIPVIKYRSNLYLEKKDILQKEADTITTKIESIFPGITKYQDDLLFQIFPDETLDPNKNKSKALHTRIKRTTNR